MAIHIHSREAGKSTFLVKMSLSTFLEDALFRRGYEDLGDGIEHDDDVGFERREGVAEVYQRRDEDEDVEDERSDIGDGHWEGRSRFIWDGWMGGWGQCWSSPQTVAGG